MSKAFSLKRHSFVALAVAVASLPPRPVEAQDIRGFEGIFGGIVGAAVEEQNRAEWARLPQRERACIDVGLRKDGINLQQFVQAGIPPNDGRIASVRSICKSVLDKKFRQNVECPINTATGVFASRCDEAFVRQDDSALRISQADLVEEAFSPRGITTALFERPDAQSRREQMMANGSTSGIVVVPNFDCANAKLDSERVICGSAPLSSLDAEYGSLYRRLGSMARQPQIARQIQLSFKQRNDCGTSDDCIRRNLEASVQFSARLLRRRGDQVETSLDRAQKLAALEAAKVKAEQQRVEQAARDAAARELAERQAREKADLEKKAAAEKAEADRKAAAQRAEDERKVAAEKIEAERRAAEARAKAEADRLARLQKATIRTNDLVRKASEFLKYDSNNPRILIIAEAIATANGSLETKNLELVEGANTALDKAIREDKRFGAFETAKAEEESKENARLLSDAIVQVQRRKRFLASYLVQNPTSVPAKSAVRLIKEGDAVLSSQDYHRLHDFSATVDEMLRQYDLQNNYLLSLNAVDDKTHDLPSTNLGLVTTPKNRFLMEGASDDLILMYVAAPTAPSVVRNLKGDIVFDNGKAVACLFQKEASGAVRDRTQRVLQDYNVQQLLIQSTPCTPEGMLSVDVIAVERGTFLKQDVAFASVLMKEVELAHIKPLVSVTGAQVATALQSIDAKRKKIEADVDHGALDGFGLVILPAFPSEKICGAVRENVDAHEAIIDRFADPAVARLRQARDLTAATVEDVFKDVQHSKCSAVYGSGPDLKLLLEALRREHIAYQIYEEPIASAQVKQEASDIATKKATGEKEALERRRGVDEARTLQAIRDRDLQSTKAAEQATLRAKFGKPAASSADDISKEVKAFFEAEGMVPAGNLGGDVTRLYPNVAAWYQAALRDHWSLQSIDSAVDDYGTVEWKGRTLEASLAVIRVKLRNPIVGDYRDGCFKVGRITDHEFKVDRDHVDVSCDNEGAVTSWKQRHAFKSVWHLD